MAGAQSTKPVPDCKVSHLTVTPDPAALATALGQRAITVAFRNHSKSTCKIEGVPDVAFVDKEDKIAAGACVLELPWRTSFLSSRSRQWC